MRVRCRDIEVQTAAWGRGAPLVLVHGLGEDHRTWRRLLPHAALDRRVIAYDVRGHGGTTLGAADGTLGQLGADLIALLDAMDIARADVCGHSLGGTIVLQAAIGAPARIGRLVPVATSSRLGRAALPWYERRAELAVAGAAALGEVLDEDARDMLAGVTEPQVIEDQIRLRREATADPAGYANACRAVIGLHRAPLDPDLARVTAPTVVVAGERDRLCPPRAGEIVAAAIPGARLHVLPGVGHHVPLQRPAELARDATGAGGDGASP